MSRWIRSSYRSSIRSPEPFRPLANSNIATFILTACATSFRQPEFANSEKMQEVLEAMEERRILRDLLPDMLAVEGVQVVIGQENRDDAMRECSVILTRYSAPGDAHGILGVLGPTRMPYRQTIPMVRYMGQVMSNLLGDDQS